MASSVLTNGAPWQLIRSARTGRLWEICIGLEVHAQILSDSKLFSGASARFSSTVKPNRHVSFFDAALPGTLPVVNRECVHQAIRTSLALNAQVHARSIFERKHYFYCDLPLGYQITQQRAPIATNGMLHFDIPRAALLREQRENVFDGSKYANRKEKNEALRKWKEQQAKHAALQNEMIPRSVRIARIQIEQDSGKSIHDLEDDSTLVDLNRAGSGLMEIVMEPDLRSPLEAGYVMKQLQHLLRHLGVCDGNMEEGSMRCDLNVSVRPRTDDGKDEDEQQNPFGERCEVKNMNSIRNMMKAAEFEALRQIELNETKPEERLERETRSFDAVTGETKRMRSKEGAKDYRFFPEPDLPPLVVQPSVIESLQATLPELPDALRQRLVDQYGLSEYESSVLVHEPFAAAFFEGIMSAQHVKRPAKMVINWVLNDLFGHLKTTNTPIDKSPVDSTRLGALIDLILDGTISGKIAKDVLELMFFELPHASPMAIVETRNWKQINDPEAIRAMCAQVVDNSKHQRNVEAYFNGKTKLFGFFMGQLMKTCQGRVNPERANSIMLEELERRR